MYFFSSSFLIGFATSIRHSIDFSITELYTANIYSNGVNEETIGKALKTYNIPHHKVVILSKCFCYVGDESWMQNPPEVKLLFAGRHAQALCKLTIGPDGQGKRLCQPWRSLDKPSSKAVEASPKRLEPTT